MRKIQTIFERDWNGNRGVINELSVQFPLEGLVATEKVDGTNVRLTIRNGTLIRLEKRRNPDKIQKQKGITEPWYVDADEFDPQDKFIFSAAQNTDLTDIEDGEYSGEAYGEKIQGNPLQLIGRTVFLFSVPSRRQKSIIPNPPTTFDKLKEWLPNQSSQMGTGKIEGIVWWDNGEPVAKIKAKDFK